MAPKEILQMKGLLFPGSRVRMLRAPTLRLRQMRGRSPSSSPHSYRCNCGLPASVRGLLDLQMGCRDTPGGPALSVAVSRLQECAGGLLGSYPNATSASLDKYRMGGDCSLPTTPPHLKTYFPSFQFLSGIFPFFLAFKIV